MSPIKSAVAVALASAVAASAYGLDASSSLASNAVSLYVGGSTAVDNTLLGTETALETLGPGGLCAAGSIDVYQIGNPTNRLTYCTGSTDLPAGLSGVPIAIFKESNVGSFNGPGPLVGAATTVTANPYQLLFLNAGTPGVAGSSLLSATNCPTAVTTTLGSNFNTYTLHNCTASASVLQVAVNPTAGIADVEANILHNASDTPFPVGSLSLLNGSPGLDVVWTLVVTKNLYYALQTAEGLTSTCTGGNLDSPNCAPSLSRAQVASILEKSTNLVSWKQLVGLNNTGGDNNVYICRRDPGSGTEASYEEYFLNARCGGAANPSGSKLTPRSEDGTFVWEQASTGNVRNCLQAFFGGGTVTSYTGFPSVTEPGNQWAIGYAAETTPGNLKASGSNLCNDCFRAIAVDGVLPTLTNVVNGYDPFFSTDVFYTTSSGPDAAGSGANATLFSTMQGRMGHPVFTAITNAAYQGTPWGNGGDLGPAGTFAAGFPPVIPATGTTVGTNPTNAYTKTLTGPVVNCNVPSLAHWTGSETVPETNLLGTGDVNHP
ncbi:MAG: hypothetical protein ACLPTM_12370 [Steroidobacteraceae bacterium]